MKATSYITENLRAFLDMELERELIEHDLNRMLRVAGRYNDFEGKSITGKKLWEEIESFIVDNFEMQRVQLREV